MEKNLAYLFIVFFIYSFIGYICEIIFSSIAQKKIVNRGFFCGPYCPIYGVGSLFILFTLMRFENDPVMVFMLGAIITSALEYFTSFVLEKIFHNKWWDYSLYKFNVHGRVCLQNSLLFGLGSLAVIYIGNPYISGMLVNLSSKLINIIAICFLIIFVVDLIYSFIVAYDLRNKIIVCEELKNQKIAKIPGMLEKLIKERVKNIKTYPKRLLEAFPNLKMSNYKEFELMKKIREKSKKKKRKK